MKTITTILLCLMSILALGNTEELNQLLIERQNLKAEYDALKDSTGINQLTKIQLLNDKHNSIVQLDESMLSYYADLSKQNSDSISAINGKLTAANFDNERMQLRTKNDMTMLTILKLAVAVLLFVILILIYFLVKRTGSKKLISGLNDRIIELENEKAVLNEEVNQLKAVSSTFIINQLHDERDQLQIEVNQLRSQLEEVKGKNKAIIQKIDKLISDLSTVH